MKQQQQHNRRVALEVLRRTCDQACPRIRPPACCRTAVCSAPIQAAVTADAYLGHLLAEPEQPIRLTADEEDALLRFLLEARPARASSPETELLMRSMTEYVRVHVRVTNESSQTINESDDYWQDAQIAMLRLIERFRLGEGRFITPLHRYLVRDMKASSAAMIGAVSLKYWVAEQVHALSGLVSDREDWNRIRFGEMRLLARQVPGPAIGDSRLRAMLRILRPSAYLGDPRSADWRLETTQPVAAGVVFQTDEWSLAILAHETARVTIARLAAFAPVQGRMMALLIGLDDADPRDRAEIARLLGRRPETVYRRLNRAFEHLRSSEFRPMFDPVDVQNRALRMHERKSDRR